LHLKHPPPSLLKHIQSTSTYPLLLLLEKLAQGIQACCVSPCRPGIYTCRKQKYSLLWLCLKSIFF